jgi:ABC-type amino acid transport substrate-binding protein
VAAQWHRLNGLLAAARGEDPELAESELRVGMNALAGLGAVGFHAQAQEELACWLATEQREEEAAALLAAARATYDKIGANGWLSRLDEWQTTHLQTLAASRTAGYPTTR